MRNSRSILLTGATGFLGSRLLQQLVAANMNVTILSRSTSNTKRIDHLLDKCHVEVIGEKQLTDMMQEHRIDTVIHVAASYGRKGESLEDVLEANLVFPFGLLQAAIQCGVKEFINTATSLLPGTNAYALSKHQFRQWLDQFRDQIKVRHLVLEYFYGPGDDAWKFVTMLFNSFASGAPRIELTSGTQKRDFIFIDDAVSAYMHVLEHANDDVHEFAVGSAKPVSIKELAMLCRDISKNTETELAFGAINGRQQETADAQIDTSALRSLGWEPETDLHTGLSITWASVNKKMHAS